MFSAPASLPVSSPSFENPRVGGSIPSPDTEIARKTGVWQVQEVCPGPRADTTGSQSEGGYPDCLTLVGGAVIFAMTHTVPQGHVAARQDPSHFEGRLRQARIRGSKAWWRVRSHRRTRRSAGHR